MDIARHLPLSQRARRDEEHITGDRRTEIAEVVREAHRLAGEVPAAEGDERVRRFLRDARLEAGAEDAARGGIRPPIGRDDLLPLADEIAADGRRSLAELQRAVHAVLALADDVDRPARIDGPTLGAVALRASATAPFDRRAAISGHTVVAVDAGWRIGRGPVLEGSAEQIARFLLGLSDVPPRARER